MTHFVAVVHQDEGSAWGLSFPDLPGCFAAAETEDGIEAAGIEALSLWFEDAAPTTPRSLGEVRAAEAEALREGAALILIPHVPRDTAKTRVNLSLEIGLVRTLDEAAARRGATRSAFVAQAVLNELRGR
ncbi:MAG: type II toxin-antitoxin system HicB family antitoxin [Pseudomonadota bacterium]